MRLFIVGKYPPIEGGVSRTNLWDAVALEEAGHKVTIVTNAREAEETYRTDSPVYSGYIASLDSLDLPVPQVIYTERNISRLHHIPMSPAYVTRLAGVTADLAENKGCDLILGHYMEPYGIAARLASAWTGVPFGLRHAGSDVGRLYQHEGMGTAFSNIAREADFWQASSRVSRSIRGLGVAEDKIYPIRRAPVHPAIFNPEVGPLPLGPIISALASEDKHQPDTFDPSRPTIGMYGKIGRSKGTFDLIEALGELPPGSANIVIVGDSRRSGASHARRIANERGVGGCVSILPFMPPWAIPSFIAACDAILFLERDFPVGIHQPAVPQEVFAMGACLIVSSEIAGNWAAKKKICDMENALVVDPRRPKLLADALRTVVTSPRLAGSIGERGMELASTPADWADYTEFLSEQYTRIAEDVKDRKAKMSAMEMQELFARLCAEKSLRRLFDLESESVTAEYDLSEEERSLLRSMDRKLLEAFSDSLRKKKWRYLAGKYPLTLSVAADDTEMLFRRFYARTGSNPGVTALDMALAFGRFLADSLPGRSAAPDFAGDLARFECDQLQVATSISSADNIDLLNIRVDDEPMVRLLDQLQTTVRVTPGVILASYSWDVSSIARAIEEGGSAGGEPALPQVSQLPRKPLTVAWRPPRGREPYRLFVMGDRIIDLLRMCEEGCTISTLYGLGKESERNSIQGVLRGLILSGLITAEDAA